MLNQIENICIIESNNKKIRLIIQMNSESNRPAYQYAFRKNIKNKEEFLKQVRENLNTGDQQINQHVLKNFPPKATSDGYAALGANDEEEAASSDDSELAILREYNRKNYKWNLISKGERSSASRFDLMKNQRKHQGSQKQDKQHAKKHSAQNSPPRDMDQNEIYKPTNSEKTFQANTRKQIKTIQYKQIVFNEYQNAIDHQEKEEHRLLEDKARQMATKKAQGHIEAMRMRGYSVNEQDYIKEEQQKALNKYRQLTSREHFQQNGPTSMSRQATTRPTSQGISNGNSRPISSRNIDRITSKNNMNNKNGLDTNKLKITKNKMNKANPDFYQEIKKDARSHIRLTSEKMMLRSVSSKDIMKKNSSLFQLMSEADVRRYHNPGPLKSIQPDCGPPRGHRPVSGNASAGHKHRQRDENKAGNKYHAGGLEPEEYERNVSFSSVEKLVMQPNVQVQDLIITTIKQQIKAEIEDTSVKSTAQRAKIERLKGISAKDVDQADLTALFGKVDGSQNSNSKYLEHFKELLEILQSDQLDVRMFSGTGRSSGAQAYCDGAQVDKYSIVNMANIYKEITECENPQDQRKILSKSSGRAKTSRRQADDEDKKMILLSMECQNLLSNKKHIIDIGNISKRLNIDHIYDPANDRQFIQQKLQRLIRRQMKSVSQAPDSSSQQIRNPRNSQIQQTMTAAQSHGQLPQAKQLQDQQTQVFITSSEDGAHYDSNRFSTETKDADLSALSSALYSQNIDIQDQNLVLVNDQGGKFNEQNSLPVMQHKSYPSYFFDKFNDQGGKPGFGAQADVAQDEKTSRISKIGLQQQELEKIQKLIKKTERKLNALNKVSPLCDLTSSTLRRNKNERASSSQQTLDGVEIKTMLNRQRSHDQLLKHSKHRISGDVHNMALRTLEQQGRDRAGEDPNETANRPHERERTFMEMLEPEEYKENIKKERRLQEKNLSIKKLKAELGLDGGNKEKKLDILPSYFHRNSAEDFSKVMQKKVQNSVKYLIKRRKDNLGNVTGRDHKYCPIVTSEILKPAVLAVQPQLRSQQTPGDSLYQIQKEAIHQRNRDFSFIAKTPRTSSDAVRQEASSVINEQYSNYSNIQPSHPAHYQGISGADTSTINSSRYPHQILNIANDKLMKERKAPATPLAYSQIPIKPMHPEMVAAENPQNPQSLKQEKPQAQHQTSQKQALLQNQYVSFGNMSDSRQSKGTSTNQDLSQLYPGYNHQNPLFMHQKQRESLKHAIPKSGKREVMLPKDFQLKGLGQGQEQMMRPEQAQSQQPFVEGAERPQGIQTARQGPDRNQQQMQNKKAPLHFEYKYQKKQSKFLGKVKSRRDGPNGRNPGNLQTFDIHIKHMEILDKQSEKSKQQSRIGGAEGRQGAGYQYHQQSPRMADYLPSGPFAGKLESKEAGGDSHQQKSSQEHEQNYGLSLGSSYSATDRQTLRHSRNISAPSLRLPNPQIMQQKAAHPQQSTEKQKIGADLLDSQLQGQPNAAASMKKNYIEQVKHNLQKIKSDTNIKFQSNSQRSGIPQYSNVSIRKPQNHFIQITNAQQFVQNQQFADLLDSSGERVPPQREQVVKRVAIKSIGQPNQKQNKISLPNHQVQLRQNKQNESNRQYQQQVVGYETFQGPKDGVAADENAVISTGQPENLDLVQSQSNNQDTQNLDRPQLIDLIKLNTKGVGTLLNNSEQGIDLQESPKQRRGQEHEAESPHQDLLATEQFHIKLFNNDHQDQLQVRRNKDVLDGAKSASKDAVAQQKLAILPNFKNQETQISMSQPNRKQAQHQKKNQSEISEQFSKNKNKKLSYQESNDGVVSEDKSILSSQQQVEILKSHYAINENQDKNEKTPSNLTYFKRSATSLVLATIDQDGESNALKKKFEIDRSAKTHRDRPSRNNKVIFAETQKTGKSGRIKRRLNRTDGSKSSKLPIGKLSRPSPGKQSAKSRKSLNTNRILSRPSSNRQSSRNITR